MERGVKVLIACEFSGTVREAFAAKGHNAWSCDFLPSEISGQHIQGDVLSVLADGWDLMIAHPPCTYLTVSGNKWYKDQPPRKSGALVGEKRREARKAAVDFFLKLMSCDIPKVAIENPIGVLSTLYRKPTQVVQPWQFGHGETKATCLWLRGLQKLKPTCIVSERKQKMHLLPKTADRWKIRSRTYQGIANAMAAQW